MYIILGIILILDTLLFIWIGTEMHTFIETCIVFMMVNLFLAVMGVGLSLIVYGAMGL